MYLKLITCLKSICVPLARCNAYCTCWVRIIKKTTNSICYMDIDHLTHKNTTVVPIKLSRNDLQLFDPASHNIMHTSVYMYIILPFFECNSTASSRLYSQREHPYMNCIIMHRHIMHLYSQFVFLILHLMLKYPDLCMTWMLWWVLCMHGWVNNNIELLILTVKIVLDLRNCLHNFLIFWKIRIIVLCQFFWEIYYLC